jgi:hypothetical protein
MATYGDGSRGDRAKELALAAVFNEPIVSSTLDEFTVKVYGETAVVWFTQQLILSSPRGLVSVTTRYVDVFVFPQAGGNAWPVRARVTPAA